jgi:molybdopterin-guanine dinucleotide biosynthesis protein A
MAADVSAPGLLPWRGAILAGGQARRLGGREKSHLRIGGRTVLERQLDAFRAVDVPVVLVVDRADRMADAPRPVIVDRWPGTGPLGGLATALSGAGAERVLAVACDLPFITPAFLELLMTTLGPHQAAVPRDQGRWHPLAAAYAAAVGPLFAETLEQGGRAIWRTLARLDVVALDRPALAPFDPDGRLLANVNTPADLEALDAIES